MVMNRQIWLTQPIPASSTRCKTHNFEDRQKTSLYLLSVISDLRRENFGTGYGFIIGSYEALFICIK